MTAGARNKLGAAMFEPKVFREQMHCIEESACGFVRTFRRIPSSPPKSPGHCALFGTPLNRPLKLLGGSGTG